MTEKPNIYLRADGCSVIEGIVTIDGFLPNVPIRIQSHAHKDHLKDFDRSKGGQFKIILSSETLELLVAEYNADIPLRKRQFCPLPTDGSRHEIVDGVEIALYSCGHLLGSSLSEVILKNGMKIVCASDFSWPISNLPNKPDILIVDATYGDPRGIRNYKRDEVEEKFVQLLADKWKEGSILIKGHRGRLESAIQIARAMTDGPLMYSDRVAKTLGVFEKHQGFEAGGATFGSNEFRNILNSGERFIAFCYYHESKYTDQLHPKNKIALSAFMVPKQDPIAEHNIGVTRVALTDHADFEETIELVKSICPSRVIADGTRGGNADALASFIGNELGIPASSNVRPTSLAWGEH
jgi:putative mRNA 3-end processing factor